MQRFYYIIFFVLFFNTKSSMGAEAGMPQLNPEFWLAQIFWLVLIFFILYILIWKLLLPKISNNIENRTAQNLKQNAEKKLVEYEKIIENAKKEAKKIILESKNKLEIDINTKKQAFEKEIENEILNVEKQIKELKEKSIVTIEKISAELSKEIIKKIFNTDVNSSSVSAMVDNVSKKKMSKYL